MCLSQTLEINLASENLHLIKEQIEYKVRNGGTEPKRQWQSRYFHSNFNSLTIKPCSLCLLSVTLDCLLSLSYMNESFLEGSKAYSEGVLTKEDEWT